MLIPYFILLLALLYRNQRPVIVNTILSNRNSMPTIRLTVVAHKFCLSDDKASYIADYVFDAYADDREYSAIYITIYDNLWTYRTTYPYRVYSYTIDSEESYNTLDNPEQFIRDFYVMDKNMHIIPGT